MGIKAILDSVDELPEELKPLYKEENDRFVLDIDGIDDHPKVRGVITANKTNKEKRDQLKAELDDIKGKYSWLPEDFDAEALDALKSAAEGKGGPPTEEQIATMRDKLTAKIEKKYAEKHQAEVAARDQANEKLRNSLHRMTIDDGLSRAMDQADIDPKHKPMLLPYLKTVGKINVEEDGETHKAVVDTDMGPMDLTKWVSEFASSDDGKRYVAKPAGPSPKGGAGGGGTKTMKRADFDALDPKTQHATVREGTQIVD